MNETNIQHLAGLITTIDWLSVTATSIGDVVAELKKVAEPAFWSSSTNTNIALVPQKFDLADVLLKIVQECTAFQMSTERKDLLEVIFPCLFVQLLLDQKLHGCVFSCSGVKENLQALFAEMKLDVANTSLGMGILSFWNLYYTLQQSLVNLSSIVLNNCEHFVNAYEFVNTIRQVLNGNKVNAKITELSTSVDLNDYPLLELISILIRNDSKKCLDMIQLSLSSNSLNSSNQNFLAELIEKVSMCLTRLDIELITFFPVQKSFQLRALEGIVKHAELFHELYLVHRIEITLAGNGILEDSYYVSSLRLANLLKYDAKYGISLSVDHIPTYSWESTLGYSIFNACKLITNDVEIFNNLEIGNFEAFQFPVITMPNYLQEGLNMKSLPGFGSKLIEGVIINMKTFIDMMILEFQAIEESDLRIMPFKLIKFKLYRILAVIFGFKQAMKYASTEVVKRLGMLIFNKCMSSFLNFQIQLYDIATVFIFCSFLKDLCFESIPCIQLCQEIVDEIMTKAIYNNFKLVPKNITVMKEFISELDPHKRLFRSFYIYCGEDVDEPDSTPVPFELMLLV